MVFEGSSHVSGAFCITHKSGLAASDEFGNKSEGGESRIVVDKGKEDAEDIDVIVGVTYNGTNVDDAEGSKNFDETKSDDDRIIDGIEVDLTSFDNTRGLSVIAIRADCDIFVATASAFPNFK
jgi:hypothetical protein